MNEEIRIAIDAMGGDKGLSVTLKGAELFLESKKNTSVHFLLFGFKDMLDSALVEYPHLREHAEVHDCESVVGMDEKPGQALRYGRGKSSMWRSVEAVKNKMVHVTVSAGNTGALMAMSRFCLKMIRNVDRPALAAFWPTAVGRSIVLDVGASIGAYAENLVDMALMGATMARIVFEIESPSVGLLNIGVEEVKGLEQIREAGQILRESNFRDLSFHGFIEGDDISKGTTNVIVTEGFTGNIALKTGEGVASELINQIREGSKTSLKSMLGAFLLKDFFTVLKSRMDPREYNGGVFLGLDGLVVKSHGGTDALGFRNAISLAHQMVSHNLIVSLDRAILEARFPESAGKDK